MTRTLEESVLASGTDDWVPLVEVDGFVRLRDPDLPPADRKVEVLAAIESLIRGGLVEVGALDEGATFRAWELPQKALMAKVHDLYTRGTDDWEWGVWLANTTMGDTVGNDLIAGERDRGDSTEIAHPGSA